MARRSIIIFANLILWQTILDFANALPDADSPEAEKLHFHLHARATNKDGSSPIYKDPNADIEARIKDLLPRMTIEEKVAQMYDLIFMV